MLPNVVAVPTGTKFFHAMPLTRPEDARPFLSEPEKHWKKGYSACELATSWITAGDFPVPVRQVLEGCYPHRNARLIEGFFEYKTDLRTPGRPSQTDLLVFAQLDSGYAVIAVEGKAAESFGPSVSEKLDGTAGEITRVQDLCRLFDLSADSCRSLRYQLFHRTVAAIYEAERYGAGHALMLVHSFSLRDSSLPEFLNFAVTANFPNAGKNCVSEARNIRGIEVRLGWVADKPS